MSSESYHEPLELLSEPTRNLHRAIVSLVEELEAVDWYNQRAEACSDPDLRAVLMHHRNEEIDGHLPLRLPIPSEPFTEVSVSMVDAGALPSSASSMAVIGPSVNR